MECKLEHVVCAFLRDLLGIYLIQPVIQTVTLGLAFTPVVPRAALEADFHNNRESSHREFLDVAVLASPCG